MNQDSICLMPWIHLYVDTNGNAKACCNTSITYGNVNSKSLTSIWNGEEIKSFRKNLLEGKKDNRCSSCFKRELAGKSSIRTETLEKFKSKLPLVAKTKKDGQNLEAKPIYLDIRYSNICNLKCRTCWHGASSSWFNDAKILKSNLGDKAIIQATSNNENLISELLSYDTQFEEIYFAGGEPLMMDEHYSILHQLALTKQTNIHLRYNTNLSVLNLKDKSAIEIWKQFPKITIAISIDGLNEKAEYIRKGLKWENLLNNIATIKKECPHVTLQIAPTVSLLSIESLGELHKFFVDNAYILINDIYLNILDRPNYYNIKISSNQFKRQIENKLHHHIEWLASNGANEIIIEEFKSVIDYMHLDNGATNYSSFIKQTKILDAIRDESFVDIFPEYPID